MDVGLRAMVICGFGWMGMELDCVRDRCCSFAKVVIVSSRAGVRFVDHVVCRECWVGYDEGDFDRGRLPCRFGWSATRAVARL